MTTITKWWRISLIVIIYFIALISINVLLFQDKNPTAEPAQASQNMDSITNGSGVGGNLESVQGSEQNGSEGNSISQSSVQSNNPNAELAQLEIQPEQPSISAEEMAKLGSEVAILHHLQDGEEYSVPLVDLIAHGKALFAANWTIDEGAGRPLTNGVGNAMIQSDRPLTFPHNMNRISGPDANSCAGCHNTPLGIVGGGGDFVGNVFVLAQRFDFVTFDHSDTVPTSGAVDERGNTVTLQTVSNNRASLGMFGAGYIEMLARQMTADLQAIRNQIQPGQAQELLTKGVSFGTLSRDAQGNWDVSKVMGLPNTSVTTTASTAPPTLVINPFHQAGGVVSLRQFSNTAYNHHHGIQSSERFGIDIDKDGDGVVNELTRADITAVSAFQAAMAVPGRVIPNNPVVEEAILIGERKFEQIGCAACHVSQLPLDEQGWIFTEPNPYNPADNLRPGEAPVFSMDLSSPELPQPRLPVVDGTVWVPAYTDLKLHNITSGPEDPNCEPLNMNVKAKSALFAQGNCRFLTRKLWGAANEPPYFHHGLFTTMREAILAHSGEALISRQAFEALSEYEQKSLIEFLKSLQVLPPGTTALVVDENGQPKEWPPVGK